MTDRARYKSLDAAGPTVFVVITVIGVAYIIVAKSFDLNALLVTVVPVLLMLGYAVCLWLFRRIRLRDDQSADNFYYMGFIFTLTSLAVALYQFNADTDSAAQIIQNFSIAVASTIAGIVLRIVFNLFRRDPMEVEHLARIELSDAARKVRLELDGVLLELAHFRRTNQQMLAEGFEEIRTQVKLTAEATHEVLEATAIRMNKQFDAHAQTDMTGQVRTELEQAVQSLLAINASLDAVATTAAGRERAVAREPWAPPWRRMWRGLFPRVEAVQRAEPMPDLASSRGNGNS